MADWMPAERLMDRLDIRREQVYTSHKGHAVELARNAAASGYRKILAVGGDGTLHETFRGIMLFCEETDTDPSEFYLGAAPIGSGNDWIKAFNIPHDTGEVIRLISRNSFTKMDVVRMEHGDGEVSYMANIGGVGFDSHVCERVNWQKQQGIRHKLIYLRALEHTIRHMRTVNLEIRTDGNSVFRGECYSIALGNGKYSGGIMCQVPQASINDGFLDAMIVPKISLRTLIKEVPRLANGSLDKSNDVIFLRCKTMEIIPLDSNSADIFEVDGEVEGKLPLRISVSGKQINAVTA